MLKLSHPHSGETREFTAPLPPDFAGLLDFLEEDDNEFSSGS